MTTKMTKLELQQINARLSAENAELRAENSALKVQLAAGGRVAHNAPCKEREYASFVEAKDNMLRLIAWDKEKRFVFTQHGNRVICKLRTTH